MSREILERLRTAYESAEPVFLPLRELGEVVDPGEFRALLDQGLRLYNLAGPGEPVMRGVEAHAFVDACFDEAERRALFAGAAWPACSRPS